MNIKVFNDGNEVFSGPLSQFLADNDNDESLVEQCNQLETVDKVEFREISGDWLIVKQ